MLSSSALPPATSRRLKRVTPTGKRHNRTKDVQAGFGALVDDEHLAGRPHARAPATVVARAPVPLDFGHQAPEVAGRACVTAGRASGNKRLADMRTEVPTTRASTTSATTSKLCRRAVLALLFFE